MIWEGHHAGVKLTYTPLETADLLRLPEWEVYRLLREGRLRGFKRGGRWFVPRREIARYQKESRKDPDQRG